MPCIGLFVRLNGGGQPTMAASADDHRSSGVARRPETQPAGFGQSGRFLGQHLMSWAWSDCLLLQP